MAAGLVGPAWTVAPVRPNQNRLADDRFLRGAAVRRSTAASRLLGTLRSIQPGPSSIILRTLPHMAWHRTTVLFHFYFIDVIEMENELWFLSKVLATGFGWVGMRRSCSAARQRCRRRLPSREPSDPTQRLNACDPCPIFGTDDSSMIAVKMSATAMMRGRVEFRFIGMDIPGVQAAHGAARPLYSLYSIRLCWRANA